VPSELALYRQPAAFRPRVSLHHELMKSLEPEMRDALGIVALGMVFFLQEYPPGVTPSHGPTA
jgi:hypothetical protein